MKHFFYDGRNLQEALPTEYHAPLVLLSVAVACRRAHQGGGKE